MTRCASAFDLTQFSLRNLIFFLSTISFRLVCVGVTLIVLNVFVLLRLPFVHVTTHQTFDFARVKFPFMAYV